ncbi:MAG: dihydrolipoyl dehydrogenase [Clostridiaceae bacterium]|nr:dihydrolipoyl dehydrogenase [Clostridiaceae bacterium]
MKNITQSSNQEREFIHADVAIIGGGPGGYVAAIKCAQNGLKTVLVEKDKLGGTCLNKGCIPTKTLASVANLLSGIKRADEFGINISRYELSLEKLRSRKEEIVSSLVQGINFLMKKNKITVIEGRAGVEEEGFLTIEGSNEKIQYKNLILATGSLPNSLPIPGADSPDILNSDSLLELEEIPETLAIIGGGVIGMEFASIYSAFGSKVYVIEYLPQILNFLDRDAVSLIKRSARKNNITIIESAKVIDIDTTPEGRKTVTFERNGKTESITIDKVAVAAGRKANLDSVDLSKLGVMINEKKNGIKVNEYMQTTNPSVYAIGDVTGQIMLAHAASRQGIIAANHLIGKKESFDPLSVPNAIFTNPEIGHVGYSEKEAREKGIEYLTGKFPLGANSKAVAMQEPDGFVKIVADKNSKKIIGATVIGVYATELLSLVTNFVALNMKIEDAKKAIYAHPTVSEAISEAIMGIGGKAIHFG